MTVQATPRRAGPFIGDGVTTQFPFAFPVFEAAHLVVEESEGDVSVVRSDYTVTLNGDQEGDPGGVVTLDSPLAVGKTLLITSAEPIEQTTVLTNMGGFQPKTIEHALDYLTILLQNQAERMAKFAAPPVIVGTDTVNVQSYGVFAGEDNPARRRELMQAAIDETAGRAVLYIPDGTWVIDRALQWRTGSIIRGAGIDQTVIKLSDDADVHANVLEPAEKDSSVVHWQISDLTLDGNYSRTSGTGSARPRGSCLATMGASYGLIERVRATGAVVHGFDICNGGEGSDYVTPEHSADPTYYPANMSRFIVMRDCIGEDAGDDAITTHYCRYIWIERCIGRNAGHRHPTVGACNGIEVDDGSRDVWVVDCLAHNVVRGFASKTHPPRPAPGRVHFVNCVAEQCNTGFYIHKSGTSTIGGDVFVINPVVRDPAEEVSQSDVPLHGIELVNIPNAYVLNPLIHAPSDSTLPLDQAISINTGAGSVMIRGGHIQNWPKGEDSSNFNGAIHATSSVGSVYIDGLLIENCGWRAISFAHASGARIRIYNTHCIGESITNSVALLLNGTAEGNNIEVQGFSAEGYTNQMSLGGTLYSVARDIYRGGRGIHAPGALNITSTGTLVIAGEDATVSLRRTGDNGGGAFQINSNGTPEIRHGGIAAANAVIRSTDAASGGALVHNLATGNGWERVLTAGGDLEAGEWTPVLEGSTTAGTQTYSLQQGRYVRVGKLMFVWFELNLTGVDGAAAGDVMIRGMPYAPASSNRQTGGLYFIDGITVLPADFAGGWYISARIDGLRLQYWGNDGQVKTPAINVLVGNTFSCSGSIVYEAA